MACCAALTLIFAWFYRLVRRFLPGHAEDEFAPPAVWPRQTSGIAQQVPAAVLARSRRDVVGQACLVVGIAWFVAGMLAMHVFHLVEPIRSLPADIAFHGSGLWLASAGLAIRLLPPSPVRTAS